MDNQKPLNKLEKHDMKLEGRKKLELTGVCEVITFDEENIILETSMGALSIKGKGMKVGMLNVESGNMGIEGFIISLSYISKDKTKKENILKKMFK
ncbi:MAG: sporulation protein YabP [Clostridium sp.]